MDTTRRGFFGVLTSLLVVPKTLLARSDEDVEYEVPEAGKTLMGQGRIKMMGLEIEGNPLKLVRANGPIHRLARAGVGRYYIEWKVPEGMSLLTAQVHIEDERPLCSYARDAKPDSVILCAADLESMKEVDAKTIFAIVMFAEKSV